jgi:hypothetical protein
LTYQHKQPGFVTISIFVIAFLFFVDLLTLTIVFWNDHVPGFVNPLLIVLALLMIVLGILFSSMTIRVDEDSLKWHFGPGFWKKTIDIHHISEIQTVANRWWYGWGIRRIPKGWLYNVSGMRAVEIQLQNGRMVRLGTDEPEKLGAAIEQAKA